MIKLAIEEVNQLLAAGNDLPGIKNQLLTALSYLRAFVDESALKGQAWTAAKNAATNVYIPLIEGEIAYVDALMAGNKKVQNAVNHFRYASATPLDEELLTVSVRDYQQNRRDYEEILQEITYESNVNPILAPTYYNLRRECQNSIDNLNAIIDELTKQIAALHEFANNVKGAYNEADSLKGNIEQAFKQIGNKGANLYQNGRFVATTMGDWAFSLATAYEADIHAYQNKMNKKLELYTVFAIPYEQNGKTKINWIIEDKKTHLEVTNKELSDYLKSYGNTLGGDIVQIMTGDEYGKHYEAALDKGYDYRTGQKLNPALWAVREGLYKLGDGMEFVQTNQIAKNLSEIGFALGVYKLQTVEGTQILVEDEATLKLSEVPPLNNVDNFKSGAIEHIFEGDVSTKGEAQGYHSEVIDNNSQVVQKLSEPDKYGVYKAKVSVNGVMKGPQSTMFPDNWSPQKIIDETNQAFENKWVDNPKKPNIFRGKASDGMLIEMWIKNGKIESAYPVYGGK